MTYIDELINTPITIDSFNFEYYRSIQMDDLTEEESEKLGHPEYDNMQFWNDVLIPHLELLRRIYIETKCDSYLSELIRLLPNSYKWGLVG